MRLLSDVQDVTFSSWDSKSRDFDAHKHLHISHFSSTIPATNVLSYNLSILSDYISLLSRRERDFWKTVCPRIWEQHVCLYITLCPNTSDTTLDPNTSATRSDSAVAEWKWPNYSASAILSPALVHIANISIPLFISGCFFVHIPSPKAWRWRRPVKVTYNSIQ